MSTFINIAVCSRSFSANKLLRDELLMRYPGARFNLSGKQLEGDELIRFIGDAEKIIVGLESITASVLDSLPNLRVISKYGVGLDMLDIETITEKGVKIGWLPGVNKRSASELTLALMLIIMRRVHESHLVVEEGKWHQVQGLLLTNKKVGIVGCGNIGQDLIMLLKPFGCSILAYDINDYDDFYNENNVQKSPSLDYLLKNSDIVTLHLPLDASTKNILNKKMLSLMKTGSFLINVARGGLIDEVALYDALVTKKIAGACFDVFHDEPPFGSPLLDLDMFYATSHIGGSAKEAVLMMGRAAIESLDGNFIN